MRSSIFLGRPIVLVSQLLVHHVIQHCPRVYLGFGFVSIGEREGDEVSVQLDFEAGTQK